MSERNRASMRGPSIANPAKNVKPAACWFDFSSCLVADLDASSQNAVQFPVK
jgi:hypothetical protein